MAAAIRTPSTTDESDGRDGDGTVACTACTTDVRPCDGVRAWSAAAGSAGCRQR